MIFFNRSYCRGYILGNIITSNTIYQIDNFNEVIVPYIRNTITNNVIIAILNDMFTPITGNEPYFYECEKFTTVKFNKLSGNGVIIYDNQIFTVDMFLNKHNTSIFDMNDIILIHDAVEYNDELEKGNI
jgi:hypothetical protein